MKNLWIAVALLFAAACGFLGYKIANRKPVYVTVQGNPLKANELGDSIDEALKVDPKLIIGKEETRLATGLKELRGVAVGPEDRIYVAGDKALIILDRAGKQLSKTDLDKAPYNVGVGPDGTAY